MYLDMAEELIHIRRRKVLTIRGIHLLITMVEMETEGIVNSYRLTMKTIIVVIAVSVTSISKGVSQIMGAVRRGPIQGQMFIIVK